MAETRETVEALHPAGKSPTRVNKEDYDAYRKALLKVIPRTKDGVRFMHLAELVEEILPDEVLRRSKPMWWVTTVKLDLEARGLVERVPKASPQRVRRAR